MPKFIRVLVSSLFNRSKLVPAFYLEAAAAFLAMLSSASLSAYS